MGLRLQAGISCEGLPISTGTASRTTCFTMRAPTRQRSGISTTILGSAALTVPLFRLLGTWSCLERRDRPCIRAPLFLLAFVLVRLDDIVSIVVNANHSIV